uniref:Uncharacterized protein n=1 Tax=Globisporangium ultimum (strain ATCC 200006 / CBS 805.95 / DAOM BR144) TaxID=431595 RepID=K3WL86_GLOUD
MSPVVTGSAAHTFQIPTSVHVEGDGYLRDILNKISKLGESQSTLNCCNHRCADHHGFLAIHLRKLHAAVKCCEQFLYLKGSTGSSNQQNFTHLWYSDLGVAKHLLDKLASFFEQIVVYAIKLSTRDRCIQVHTVCEMLNVDGRLMCERKSSLRMLACRTETT